MQKRVVSLIVAVSLLLSSLFARIGYIMFNGSYTVSDSYNSYSLTIEKPEFQLYYRNGEKLNNDLNGYVAVIRPNEKCIGELYKIFNYDKIQTIMKELSKGYPIVVELEDYIETKYIDVFKTHKSSVVCPQLINKSSSGLLKYTNETQNTLKINFSIDAKGRLLSGDNGTLKRNESSFEDGLTLSIDKSIQEIVVDACNEMVSGCCIVMDVNSGEVLACVNKPDDCYINKCFENYPVGSVFKLIIAASALENDINSVYNCTGSIRIGDSTFSCQNDSIHGYQTLKTALANSCNCYFVNLALDLGYNKILETSNEFGFDKTINLYNDWNIKTSNLPSSELLNSKGQLALFGFGQGKLTSTPLQICSSLSVIANKGIYKTPTILKSSKEGKSVISKETADNLLKYMRYVVENGTGKNADDSLQLSAGKTATAQTGQYDNGIELLNTWFAGVYPYNEPKYAIVVMTENGISGSKDCCPIFRTIVENINKI